MKDGHLDETAAIRHPANVPGALSLLLMTHAGTAVIPLPANGTVVLGRAPDCDLPIDDAKLSRRHAELRLHAERERVELVDLGSKNGCFVREERIPANVPTAIRVGDSMRVGSTVLVLQRAALHSERPRHIWTHGYFEARLEEECARAAKSSATFAVLRLRLTAMPAGRGSTEAGDLAPSRLFAWLAEGDVVAEYAPREYEILLTATTAAEAEARASDLETILASSRVPFRVALAIFPRDGRTPEALVERTTARVREGAGVARGSLAPDDQAIGALARMAPFIQRIAAGVINVLVLGETGVGKEVLAHRIHELSARASQPLVALNCASLSESLLESELFGHEKGAFTGAVQSKAGLLESARGGTVFLDEVGEMPLTLQVKLLRVLEQREVVRVGAVRPIAIDARFIAATNRDLEREIAAGRFRQDLYFRLNGVAIALPPLRERKDEIEPLARVFVAHACKTTSRAKPPRLATEVVEVLERYTWPGNIRELRNVIERAVLLCSGEVITKDHLPMEKLGLVVAPAPVSMPLRSSARPAPAGVDDDDDLDSVTGEIAIADVEAEEKKRIMAALDQCGGNQSQAAKVLGMSRQTIIRRIEEFGIARPRKRE